MIFTGKRAAVKFLVPLGVSLLLCTQPVQARMYQWVNPETGHTQLSGKPPAWYRSEAGGPRVFVFENGQLVDDTDVRVDELHRSSLRDKAFSLAHSESLQAQQRREQLKAAMQRQAEPEQATATTETDNEESLLAQLLVRAVKSTSTEPAKQAAKTETSEQDTAEQLKALIDAWDEQRASQARQVLESTLP